MLDDASIFEPRAATTFQELYEGFLAAISLNPCVLVVDGVDELGSTLGIEPQQIKKFEWIPLPLPSNCRMILTTSTSDFSYRSLSERGDIKHLTLPQLKTANLKMKYLEEHMQMHYNHLKQEHISIIFESKLSSRPLFLTLLGNEIASFSVYTDLKAFLESTVEMCSSLRDLFTRCIKRWKKELSWSWEVIPTDGSGDEEELEYTGWIPDILRLLAVSRSGLTQCEILDILYQIGYQENVTVGMYDWLLFQQCAGSCLYEKPNGLLSFSHQHLREIVEYELLRTVKPSAADIVPLQSDKDKVWREKKKSYHKHLVQYFSSLPISQHCVEELPWQLLMSGDLEGLTNVVTNPEIFMMLADLDGQNPSNVHDLLMYWHYLKSQGVSPAKSYLQVLVKAGVISHELEAQELSVDGSVFEEEDSTIKESSHNGSSTSPVTSRIYTASPIQERQLSVIEESLSTTESETNLARHINHKIITKNSQEQNMDEKEEMDDMFVTVSKSSDGSLPTLNLNLADGKLTKLTWHIGVLLRDLGEISVAEKVFTALQDLLHKNFPLSEENQLLLARVMEVLGHMHLEKGNTDEAEKMLKKTLRILMDIPDTEDESPIFPCIEKMKGEVLGQIGYLRLDEGILDDAEDLLQESLEFSDKWDTLSHRATILFHFGLLRVKRGDFMMAENSLRNALSLRERWYGKSHPLIAEVLFHLAILMCNLANDRFDKYSAEDIFRRALDIREKYYGKEHPLCGDVLFELGKMLSEEPSFAAKMEACRILSKVLDIRIRKLGEKHIDTRAVRHYLNELEISIKKGKYEYGPSKPTDVRTLERPFSSLSWRENDLENLGKKFKSQPGKTKTHSLLSRSGSRLTVSRPGSNLTGSRPGSRLIGSRSGMQSSKSVSHDNESVKSYGRHSNLSYVPMSERLLLESDRPRLLQQRGSMERRLKQMTDAKQMSDIPVKKMVDTISSMRISPSKSDQVSEETNKQQITVDLDFSKADLTEARTEEHALDSFAEDSYRSGVKFALVPKVQIDEEQNVEISPTQPPVRLFKRLGSAKSGSSSIHSSRQVSVKPKRPGGSARSIGSSLYTAVSTVSGYSMDSTSSRRTSGIPAGPDSVLTNARTATIGPYSSVQSILPVQCPRDISHRIHHKSAWYHVPGRYKTPKTKYPPKRSQRRPGNFIPPEPKITYSPPHAGDAYRNIKTCQRGHVVSFGPMEEIPNNREHQVPDYANGHVYQGNSILDLSPTVTGLNPTGPKSSRHTTFIVDEAMPSEDIHVYPSHGTMVTFKEAVMQN
ncbi:hypothetical protein CHS0354_038488 [Potamilus streckersoni]|uniref:Uncharacterized protein n=1 Tax=Potamilus streckersoni TaxID=2493646 RepID=A0AAE0VQ72_9BIVA|nr:hypothetical protein CHS0354_038488 [Potamilus streckersoni]